jgi:hypothetical protein
MFIQPDKYQVHTKVQTLMPAYANILGSANIAEQSQYIQMYRKPSLLGCSNLQRPTFLHLIFFILLSSYRLLLII